VRVCATKLVAVVLEAPRELVRPVSDVVDFYVLTHERLGREIADRIHCECPPCTTHEQISRSPFPEQLDIRSRCTGRGVHDEADKQVAAAEKQPRGTAGYDQPAVGFNLCCDV